MRYLLFFFCVPLLIHGQTATDYIKQAHQAEQNGKIGEALHLYDKAIALRPQTPNPYIRRGNIKGQITDVLQEEHHTMYLFDRQNYTEALTNFNQAIALDTNNYIGHYARGNLNMIYQKPKLAIDDFTNVLAKTDDLDIACYSLNQRGLAKMQAQYYESASDDFHNALTLSLTNNKYNIYNNIALLNSRIGNQHIAFEAIIRAIQLAPQDLRTQNNFALLNIEVGQAETAIQLFEELISQSEDPLFYNNRAYAYYQLKNYTIALQDVNTSLKLWKENAYAYRNRALIYIAQKKYHAACSDLEIAEKYGFSKIYGDEIKKLKAKYCW